MHVIIRVPCCLPPRLAACTLPQHTSARAQPPRTLLLCMRPPCLPLPCSPVLHVRACAARVCPATRTRVCHATRARTHCLPRLRAPCLSRSHTRCCFAPCFRSSRAPLSCTPLVLLAHHYAEDSLIPQHRLTRPTSADCPRHVRTASLVTTDRAHALQVRHAFPSSLIRSSFISRSISRICFHRPSGPRLG